jgi:APA family basic amino acid/polyamine antiporter
MNEPVRAWWFPAAPIIFIALSITISLLIVMHNPLPALMGVGIVLCGLPLHQFLIARQVAAPIPNEGS